MNCRQAQREIALLVGEDLGDDERREEVQLHLKRCPECRRHQARLGTALSALVSAEPASTYDSVYSVWPSLRRQLSKDAAKAGPPADWRTWTPFAAGVATCAGLLLMVSGAWKGTDSEPLGRQIAPGYPVYPTTVEPIDESKFETQSTVHRRHGISVDAAGH